VIEKISICGKRKTDAWERGAADSGNRHLSSKKKAIRSLGNVSGSTAAQNPTNAKAPKGELPDQVYLSPISDGSFSGKKIGGFAKFLREVSITPTRRKSVQRSF